VVDLAASRDFNIPAGVETAGHSGVDANSEGLV
jgi:hypothetical protein